MTMNMNMIILTNSLLHYMTAQANKTSGVTPSTFPSFFNMDEIEKLNVENITPPALVEEKQGDALINTTADFLKTTPTIAFALIAIILQKGGTSKKAQGNIYAIVNGIRLDLNTLRDLAKKSNSTYTLRQWARTYANLIFTTCYTHGIEGDLAKKIARNRPEIQDTEKIWLSNFQMDNPSCPENIRTLLLEHYQSLFGDKNKK